MNEIEDVILSISDDDDVGQARLHLAELLRQGYSIIATRAVGDDTDGIWFVLFKARFAASVLVDEEIYQDLDDPDVADYDSVGNLMSDPNFQQALADFPPPTLAPGDIPF